MYLFVNDTDTQCSVFLLDLLMETLCAHILSQMSQLNGNQTADLLVTIPLVGVRDSMLIKLLEKILHLLKDYLRN